MGQGWYVLGCLKNSLATALSTACATGWGGWVDGWVNGSGVARSWMPEEQLGHWVVGLRVGGWMGQGGVGRWTLEEQLGHRTELRLHQRGGWAEVGGCEWADNGQV